MTRRSVPEMNPAQKLWAGCYCLVMLCALPQLFSLANSVLSLREGQLNFLYYLLNFLVLSGILGGFLQNGFRAFRRKPVQALQSIVLALAAYYACFWLYSLFTRALPGFSNANNDAVIAMAREDFFLTAVGTVLLVPPVEELIFRGLLFGSALRKSPSLAYSLSALAFGLLHILGYIGQMSPVYLVIALLGYLPAGIWLAWCYRKSGTILAPITAHALINGLALLTLR